MQKKELKLIEILNSTLKLQNQMAEEFKEVTDYKKIFLVAGIIVVGVIVFALVNPLKFESTFDIKIPEIIPENSFFEGEPKIDTEKTSQIKPEYLKYLDLGLTYDDILDFQDLPCSTFDTPEIISTDSKYTAIIEQRKIDCNI